MVSEFNFDNARGLAGHVHVQLRKMAFPIQGGLSNKPRTHTGHGQKTGEN